MASLVATFLASIPSTALGQESPGSFDSRVSLDQGAYVMNVEMTFAAGIPMREIVAALKNPWLPTEINPAMKVERKNVEIQNGSNEIHFDSVLTLSSFFLKSHFVSQCHESFDGALFKRQCTLDTTLAQGGRFMEYKNEDLKCQNEGAQSRCRLRVIGKLKNIFFLKKEWLAVKAKAEAVKNWGTFWCYVNEGSISVKQSRQCYDQSSLPSQVQAFQKSNQESKDKNEEFHFSWTAIP
jgi:hypothetical protein